MSTTATKALAEKVSESIRLHLQKMGAQLDPQKVGDLVTDHINKLASQELEITEYDPATCITAGELRAMGMPIPGHIPDCGWIPRWSMRITATTPEHSPKDIAANILRVDLGTSFLVPFRWVELSAIVGKTP